MPRNILGVLTASALVASAGLMAAPAAANVITFTFGNEFSGSGFSPTVNPFGEAVISDVAGGVEIQINLFNTLDPGAFTTGAYFNYGTTSADVAALAGATVNTGGTQPPESVQVASNGFKADGDGSMIF
jgi:hypothetical protein